MMMQSSNEEQCLLCRLRVEIESAPEVFLPGNFVRSPDELIVICKRCGKYRVPFALATGSVTIPNELKTYLSAATRQAHDRGRPMLLDQNLEELAAPHRGVSISQKIDKVFQFVAGKCQHPGTIRAVDDDLDYPVADCESGLEFIQYLEYLEAEKLMIIYRDQEDNWIGCTPSIKGWQAIEPTLPVGGERDRCFVAMWFDDSLDSAYEMGFVKAIEACGFKCYRIKEDPTNKGIADKILAEIRRSRFVVADFTGQRTSVYYEAGFAHGLGREVIGCCRADDVKGLTFDTRHLGHIVWRNSEELREKLADSIRANIIPMR